MADSTRLVTVLSTCRSVLLDFDGPLCDVFSGHPAAEVAENLRRRLVAHHVGRLPDDTARTSDPLVIVRRVAEFAPHLSSDVDAALSCAELHAATTAEPTPGSVAFLHACRATGRPVAIVSNNSTPAIKAYLELHELDPFVQHVQGRDASDPRRMKPATFLLAEAVTALAADPTTTVMVGDSRADLDAARTYGVRMIGLVNKPGKAQTFSGADALITAMDELASLVAGTPRPPELRHGLDPPN